MWKPLAFALLLAPPAWADIGVARDLMEASRFEEAYQQLWPAAR